MDLVDTLEIVPAESGEDSEPRGRTMPIKGRQFEWWTNAVRRQLDAKGMEQKDLAAELDVDTGRLSRCINRKVPTYGLLLAISDYLEIAYPVLLPESEEEALALAKAKRLYKRDLEAKKIKAGVPDSRSEDQPPGVVSEHAVRSQKAKGTQKPRERRSEPRP